MRILLVYDHFDTGGVRTHSLALTQDLRKAWPTLFIRLYRK